MPLASHITLPERYRVARHIASGGMASVWEVEDLLLGRIVAVKVLGAQYALDPGARARFQREARTSARVADHPNIATIYDIGEHGDDAFIVMEHYSGGTVADRLRAARDGGQRVPRETALRWLREAAAAIDVAHAADIVHRDVKPANLLLDAQDRLVVGDFGIAKLADDTHMTQTGQVLGTAAYLSPEQALGLAATPASDRYALAVVAYELLTGRRPFAGGSPSVQARQHAELEPERASLVAPELSPAVDAVLARGLAKEPAARPATAGDLVDDLQRALRVPGSDDEPVAPTRRLTPVMPVPAPLPLPGPSPSSPPPPIAARVPASAPGPASAPPAAPMSAREPVPAHARPASRPRRVTPLALVATGAVVGGVVLAVLLGSGDRSDPQTARSEPRATQTAAAPARSTATAPATAPVADPDPASEQPAAPAEQPQRTAATAPAAAGTDPAALNAKGFELNKAERYGDAVAPLQASVQGFRDGGRTDERDFAYALYNLGVALNRSGNPTAAIPVLEERLNYADQVGTVRTELRDAQRRAGQKPGAKARGDKRAGAERSDDG